MIFFFLVSWQDNIFCLNTQAHLQALVNADHVYLVIMA